MREQQGEAGKAYLSESSNVDFYFPVISDRSNIYTRWERNTTVMEYPDKACLSEIRG